MELVPEEVNIEVWDTNVAFLYHIMQQRRLEDLF
jgi:hypothetical protein